MTTREDYELLLGAISHELRNPVTLINSYLQLLENRHPEVRNYSQWEPIQAEMAHLIALLEDISMLRASASLQKTPVDMQAWFDSYALSAQLLVKSLALAKFASNDAVPGCADIDSGISSCVPEFHYLPETPLPTLCIDASRIRQLLDNLLRNAVDAVCATVPAKTTATIGTITLRTSFTDGVLRIGVADTGCGIAPENLSSIFLPFVTHKKGGSGLGLALCQRIAAAHGGTITVCCTPREGTVFTVLLPEDGKGSPPG